MNEDQKPFLKSISKANRKSEIDFADNCFESESQISPKYVVYIRVSTTRQGESGLGLEAQRESVRSYLAGRPHQILSEWVEIESGKKSVRPKLMAALAECRKKKAILIIAKIDRLSRSLHFVSGLMESGVEFLAVDFPQANRFVIHVMAAVGEHEREMISKRTRDALAAAKARGTILGANGKNLAAKEKAAADERARVYQPMIRELLATHRSYSAVARKLNELGVATPFDGRWHSATIRNICLRRV